MAHGSSDAPLTLTDRLFAPAQQLMDRQSASGIVLIFCALLAFIWANSAWAEFYVHMRHIDIGVDFGNFHLHMPLDHFVNDFLMAIFFFVVGLEIKREFLVGELAGVRRAALPIAGALGGMILPAAIYAAINWGEPTIRGWGVPMATDIAFAVGVLALIGDRVPLALKVFLLALAIVDDLGAVIVIAVFYTADLHLDALLWSFAIWGVAVAYGRYGHARALVFVALGALCWYFMHESGVHATIAGVLIALAVPIGGRIKAETLEAEVRQMMLPSAGDVDVKVQRIGRLVDRAQSPLLTFEHGLSRWVAFFIMPVFALFNAGVPLDTGVGPAGAPEASLIGLPTIGAFFGLLIGKPIGIVMFAYLAVASGLASFPRGANWLGMVGIGCLGGIGFTMALFVANLAFGVSLELDQAKIGVLSASVISAIVGFVVLTRAFPLAKPAPSAAEAHQPGE